MTKDTITLSKAQQYIKEKLGHKNIDIELLDEVINFLAQKSLSPDAVKVACSDKEELAHIRDQFLVGYIGLVLEPNELDKAIKVICVDMGSSNRNKRRDVFYYMLIRHLDVRDKFMSMTAVNENTVDPKPSDSETMASQLEDIVKKYARYTAAVGFAPLPLIDLAAIGVIQHRMIGKLAKEFPQIDAKARMTPIIASIVGGITSVELGILTKAAFKRVPVIGTIIGGASTSIYAYYSTLAIGEIFIEHFLSGGDLSIDLITYEKMKERYKDLVTSFKLST
jgi:uncharacterized protein (DUF697 family)